MKSVAVFNNDGGIGKTSLVYHLAWMYARLDCNVPVADLDPQANLTSMFLNDEELAELWADDREDGTIYTCLRPLLATLRPYRSLMPLAQEARKPMFALKPADGIIGGLANAVRGCYRDFRALARAVAGRCGVAAA